MTQILCMISVATFDLDPQCHLEHQRSHSSRLLIQKSLFCERLIRLGSAPSLPTTTTHPSYPLTTTTTCYLAYRPEPGNVFLVRRTTKSNPERQTHPCRRHRRHPETFQNIVDLHKHSYTLKTSSTAGLKKFVVKNLHDWKIILKISCRHFISGHLIHSEVSSARTSKAQQCPKCIFCSLRGEFICFYRVTMSKWEH